MLELIFRIPWLIRRIIIWVTDLFKVDDKEKGTEGGSDTSGDASCFFERVC